MSAVRARVERLERGLVGDRGTPPRVWFALQRMEARQALFQESFRNFLRDLRVEYAIAKGETPTAPEPNEEFAKRCDEARRLLGADDEVRHRSDRNEVLHWEQRTRGGPAELSRRWRGAWQRRQMREILATVNAEFGILDDREVEVLPPEAS